MFFAIYKINQVLNKAKGSGGLHWDKEESHLLPSRKLLKLIVSRPRDSV